MLCIQKSLYAITNDEDILDETYSAQYFIEDKNPSKTTFYTITHQFMQTINVYRSHFCVKSDKNKFQGCIKNFELISLLNGGQNKN